MKNLFSYLILLVSFSLSLNAQDQDAKAKAILDDLSKTTKSYKSIVSEYVFTITSKDKKQLEKQTGKVQVKNSKFKLEIPGNIIVCDGKTIWSHNKDANEVTIKSFDPTNEDQLNPSKIFTIYEKGYKYQYDKEEKIGTTVYQIISLYPSIKPEKKKFHTVKLYIDKNKKQIAQLVMLMKDGSINTYEIKSFKPNVDLPDAIFVFDLKPFKSDQITDERD